MGWSFYACVCIHIAGILVFSLPLVFLFDLGPEPLNHQFISTL